MKDKMKKIWLSLSAALLIIAFIVLSNPLRRSDKALHVWLLKCIPVGSGFERLQSVAKQKGWRINSVWDGGKPDSDGGGMDSAKVAWVYLGGYRNVFHTDLDSFWAFDAAGRLVDVKTRRMTDAL